MKVTWSGRKVQKTRINNIMKEENLNPVVAGIASNRFLDNYHNALHISKDSFHMPSLLNDMDKAVDRILLAIENEEKVLIYGDYDADGITSTAIMYGFLKDQDVDVSYYIPNRLSDGYGLNIQNIANFKKLGYTLIITVDNGIVAFDEAKYAKENGIDLVITDHHEMQEKLPDAIAVVDPKRNDSTYPFKDICGAFVAYKVVEEVSMVLGMPDDYLDTFMSIAAIGTIADVMPLEDENRAIVHMGLSKMSKCNNYGVKSLIQGMNITAENIAYNVVPKLNASGRLGKDTAAELLTADSMEKAKKLKLELDNINEERKRLVSEQEKELVYIIEEDNLDKMPIIIAYAKKLHEGIIGILAAKIAEKYNKSTLVLTDSENEKDILKGSGRAKDSNIFEALSEFKELYTKFGGHEKALGLSIEKENLKELMEKVKKMKLKEQKQIIYYDMIMEMKDLNIPLIRTFKVLEPFGEKNPKPTFLLKDVLVKKIYEREKVTSVMIEQNGITNFAITFDTKKISENNILEGDNTYILVEPYINLYNGKESLGLKIIDIQKV